MKKERQIGVRVGLPAFFALELEDVYRHSEGAHRALAFPDFVGLLVGMGLETYRKTRASPEAAEEEAAKDGPEETEDFHRDINPAGLHDLLREFDEALEPPDENPRIPKQFRRAAC